MASVLNPFFHSVAEYNPTFTPNAQTAPPPAYQSSQEPAQQSVFRQERFPAQPPRYAPNLGIGSEFGLGGRAQTINVNHNDATTLNAARQHTLEDREEDRANSAASGCGIAMILIALASGWIFTNLQKESAALERVNNYLNNDLYYQLPENLRQQGLELATAHRERVKQSYIRTRNYTILTGMLFASATAAFAGGMIAIQAVITGAIIGAVVTGTIGAFYASYNFFNPIDQTPSNPAEEQALQNLCAYEDSQQAHLYV